MSTPEELQALEIITTWKSSPTIRTAFDTLGAYADHVKNPESSTFKVINQNGQISVVKNKDRHLSASTALDIVKTWQNDPSIRAEFGTLNIYRCYVEGVATGKIKIIGQH